MGMTAGYSMCMGKELKPVELLSKVKEKLGEAYRGAAMPIDFGKPLAVLKMIDEELGAVKEEIFEREQLPSAIDLVKENDLAKSMVVEELKLPKINVDVGDKDEPMTKKGDEKVIETDRGNDVNLED